VLIAAVSAEVWVVCGLSPVVVLEAVGSTRALGE